MEQYLDCNRGQAVVDRYGFRLCGTLPEINTRNLNVWAATELYSLWMQFDEGRLCSSKYLDILLREELYRKVAEMQTFSDFLLNGNPVEAEEVMYLDQPEISDTRIVYFQCGCCGRVEHWYVDDVYLVPVCCEAEMLDEYDGMTLCYSRSPYYNKIRAEVLAHQLGY